MFLTDKRTTTSENVQANDRSTKALMKSAELGYEPAQECLISVFGFLGLSLPFENARMLEFLRNAVQAGSRLAYRDLFVMDASFASQSLSAFEANGGYATFYCQLPSYTRSDYERQMSMDPATMLQVRGHTWLHWLVVHGTTQEVDTYLKLHPQILLDGRTIDEYTALHLACMRGSLTMLQLILERGASATQPCGPTDTSPLHWVIAFRPEYQRQAIEMLLHHGAQIDHVVRDPLAFPFYPFVLPAGSPLHWCVATESHAASSRLIEAGSNILLRNGLDPYRYDDRVRILDSFGRLGVANPVPYSIPEAQVLGLSPLDVAAGMHDAHMFHCVASSELDLDINDHDEEGFTAAHHISASYEGFTLRGVHFSHRYYRGSRPLQMARLKDTIESMLSSGVDINKLSLPKPLSMKSRDRFAIPTHVQDGATPLMLSMWWSYADVVGCLLAAGADPNIQNGAGVSASLCVGKSAGLSDNGGELTVRCFQALEKYGADLNHCAQAGSVIMRLAEKRFFAALSFVLSTGADIDVHGMPEFGAKYSDDRNLNWIASMVRADAPMTDKNDTAISRLLQTHVLSHPDQALVQRLLDCCDCDGSSVLHYFAGGGLLNCIKLLLGHGVKVNTLKRESTHGWADTNHKQRIFIEWYCTPLDIAIKRLQRHEKERNAAVKRYSSEQVTDLVSKSDKVVQSLRDSGAQSARDLAETRRPCVCKGRIMDPKRERCDDHYPANPPNLEQVGR